MTDKTKKYLNLVKDYVMITLGLFTYAFGFTAFILDGVTVDPWWWAVIVAIVLGFINACIRPLVKLLALPINFMTLGLFTFVINGLMVMLCSWVVRHLFEVANFLWALGFSIVLTLVSWALHLFRPSTKQRESFFKLVR